MIVADLFAIGVPKLGVTIDRLEVTRVESDHIKVPEIKKSLLCRFNFFYFSFYSNEYQSQLILKYYRNLVSLFCVIFFQFDQLLFYVLIVPDLPFPWEKHKPSIKQKILNYSLKS